MPRYCTIPGCPTLVERGRCAAHNRQAEAMRPGADTWRRWYRTAAWLALRLLVLAEEPVCRICAANGVTAAAVEVDHIVPHRGVWALFIDRGNLQGLCKSCHSRKTQAGL